MALRGSISRTFMSTDARSPSFRSSPPVPRILSTPISTAQSLLPLAGARITSQLIVNVRAFCNLSQDTSHVSSTVNDPVDSKTPKTSQTLNEEIKERDVDDSSVQKVSLQELYAALLPKLKEKGFFDACIDVASSNAKFGIRTSLEATVHSFKSVLEQRFEIPAGLQCLICHGNMLEVMEDHRTLKSYGLASGHVYLIVMGGPLKNQAQPDVITALASPARFFQGLYDSNDNNFRELVKHPYYFRQYNSDSPMTELQMMTIDQYLASGVRQQQTTHRDAVKSSSSDRNRNRRRR